MGSRLSAEKGAARKIGVPYEEWLRRRSNDEYWCYCCKEWRQRGAFGRDQSRSNGLTSACKACVSHKATAWRYRLSVDHARDLRSSARCCDICSRKIRLEVDHDHATGAVRGALCGRCNKAIGLFKDSPELIRRALAYLERKEG